jgi:hypothetical protein
MSPTSRQAPGIVEQLSATNCGWTASGSIPSKMSGAHWEGPAGFGRILGSPSTIATFCFTLVLDQVAPRCYLDLWAFPGFFS